MARRLLDLSITLDNDTVADPPGTQPRISYSAHHDTVAQVAASFPGLAAADLPDGQGWAVERADLSTHNGTHMDAPYHYHATQDAALPGGARRAMTIDEIPLDWCWRPGVKLNFRHLPDGHVVGSAEIANELERIGHKLQPLDIVLVNTAAGAAFGQPDYVSRGCGMGREATLFLAGQGVRVVGTDGWSWDAPFVHTARRWQETGDASIIWEGHKAGREIGYCQLEKLANLDQLPPTGFEVMCFPVKIKAASAGWSRVVAVLPD
ncbi:cyclase family protein [Sphingomonas sp. NBWT7]|uniref:cyclase family protein n=1 Tax=Sphingomonas sp. NBWT7 TaxID=2596913 RepID=UPI001628073C|nr:cyclase family protein [Sphingomonas sp. NBWT7]QNE32925.1 cyclase family protein [Sphingomonas sp. NBWT7]